MARFIKVVLYVNVVIITVVSILGYGLGLLPVDPAIAQSAVLARTYAGTNLGVGLAFLLVARMFTRDPRWLLVPIVAFPFHLAQSAYELVATPGAPVPPVVLSSIFLTIYIAGFLVLSRRASQSAAPSRAYGGVS